MGAPRASCALDASNDYQPVNAWLSLHESAATQRAYRKEAERLILWAIVERGRALSSLTTEDAMAYRAFLGHSGPRARWVGAPQPRSSPAWRPFAGDLSAHSAADALSVLNALYRWLIEQRYVLTHREDTDHGPQVNERLILRGTVDSDLDEDHRVPMVVMDGRDSRHPQSARSDSSNRLLAGITAARANRARWRRAPTPGDGWP